jgi:hypothetical protein
LVAVLWKAMLRPFPASEKEMLKPLAGVPSAAPEARMIAPVSRCLTKTSNV